MVDELREFLASYFNEQARILIRVDDDDAKQRKGRIERLALSRKMLTLALWRVSKASTVPCPAIKRLTLLMERPLAGDDTEAWKLLADVELELREMEAPQAKDNGKPRKQELPQRKQTVNQRIHATPATHPKCSEWTAEQWATHLDCAASTVVDTPYWNSLKVVKAGAKIARLGTGARKGIVIRKRKRPNE